MIRINYNKANFFKNVHIKNRKYIRNNLCRVNTSICEIIPS